LWFARFLVSDVQFLIAGIAFVAQFPSTTFDRTSSILTVARFAIFAITLLRRERYYRSGTYPCRSGTYPCRSATYPWDDSLPIGAEYPRHVREVTEIGTSDLVRDVYENRYTDGNVQTDM
jgi:hypothetical protein